MSNQFSFQQEGNAVKPNTNLIACILDRSGSMASIRAEAIGGFNNFLAEQKKLPGEARITLVLFDDQYDIIQDGIDIHATPDLTEDTFVPRGMTALNDAVGRTIDTIGKRLANMPDSERPEQVIVAILTDGLENASKKYSRPQVAEMVKHQQERYGWQFVFLGANMDAKAEAINLNIPAANAANFAATAIGTRGAYSDMSTTVSSLRAGNNSASGGLVSTDKISTSRKVKA